MVSNHMIIDGNAFIVADAEPVLRISGNAAQRECR